MVTTIKSHFVIKVRDNEDQQPLGSIVTMVGQAPEGYLRASGQLLNTKDYPEAAEVIGDGYLPSLYRLVKKSWWVFEWNTYEPVDLSREYGVFRLPDLD